jgi:hypothetical protein
VSEIKLDFTGDASKAQSEFDKLTRTAAKFREEIRQLSDQSREGASKSLKAMDAWAAGMKRLSDQTDPWKRGMAEMVKQQDAFRAAQSRVDAGQGKFNNLLRTGVGLSRELGSSLGSAVNGYIGAAAVVAGITAELRSQVELQKELAKFHQGAAGSQAKFLRNLGLVTSGERESALSQLRGISARTGVPEKNLFAPAATAVSAKGGLTVKQALDAVEMAALVAPEDTGEMTAVAGGLLDTASLTGTASTQRNIGFITQLAAQARVTDLQSASRHLIPGAIGVKGFGGSAESAAALVSTMTNAMKDASGEMSGTASIRLAEQLAEFLPESDRFTFDKKTGRRKLAAKGTGLADTASRIARLQSDASLREKFLATATFEAKATIPSRDILTPGTEVASLFTQNTREMGLGTEAAGRQFVESLQAGDLQQTAAIVRRTEQLSEARKLARVSAARSGSAYDALDKALEAEGYGWTSRTITAGEVFLRSKLFGQSTAEASARTLEDTMTTSGDSMPKEQRDFFQQMITHLRNIDKNSANKGVNIDAHTE